MKAGDELPSDFTMPRHLRIYIVPEDPPQISQASASDRLQGGRGAEAGLAKPAAEDNYPEGKEEFAPKWKLRRMKKGKL